MRLIFMHLSRFSGSIGSGTPLTLHAANRCRTPLQMPENTQFVDHPTPLDYLGALAIAGVRGRGLCFPRETTL